MHNMSKIRLTKEFTFEMAHVLSGYDGPCANIHGHSYKLAVTVIGAPIKDLSNPKLGMVMDFGDLKRIVKTNVINRFDHILLLRKGTELSLLAENGKLQKTELVDYQPTCENFLLHIAQILSKELPLSTKLHHLKLHETPTSYAEWFADDNV
jgi:6-pyruvoyltetrahydropterin/6-carboxytetrahydropterin synthase